jgi:hypothetical protein
LDALVNVTGTQDPSWELTSSTVAQCTSEDVTAAIFHCFQGVPENMPPGLFQKAGWQQQTLSQFELKIDLAAPNIVDGSAAAYLVQAARSVQRGVLFALMRFTGEQNPADVSAASEKLPCLPHMKPNREKIEAEELVKERLPLTKWELTPKEKEDFNRVMRLMFDAASILRYDLELGEDAIGKTLKELADWATN